MGFECLWWMQWWWDESLPLLSLCHGGKKLIKQGLYVNSYSNKSCAGNKAEVVRYYFKMKYQERPLQKKLTVEQKFQWWNIKSQQDTYLEGNLHAKEGTAYVKPWGKNGLGKVEDWWEGRWGWSLKCERKKKNGQNPDQVLPSGS